MLNIFLSWNDNRKEKWLKNEVKKNKPPRPMGTPPQEGNVKKRKQLLVMKKIIYLLTLIPFLALGQSPDQNWVKTITYKQPTAT
ncbi:hypothetical protein SY27_11160, partial [Flavobacterium sp. 316]